jgi:hypothetical protein
MAGLAESAWDEASGAGSGPRPLADLAEAGSVFVRTLGRRIGIGSCGGE